MIMKTKTRKNVSIHSKKPRLFDNLNFTLIITLHLVLEKLHKLNAISSSTGQINKLNMSKCKLGWKRHRPG